MKLKSRMENQANEARRHINSLLEEGNDPELVAYYQGVHIALQWVMGQREEESYFDDYCVKVKDNVVGEIELQKAYKHNSQKKGKSFNF